MAKSKNSYSSEFKEEAIKLALSSTSVCATAKSIGIPEATLHGWIRKAKKSGQQTVVSKDNVVNHVNVSSVIDENQELRKKIARLEQEKAILKKAATYFAAELK